MRVDARPTAPTSATIPAESASGTYDSSPSRKATTAQMPMLSATPISRTKTTWNTSPRASRPRPSGKECFNLADGGGEGEDDDAVADADRIGSARDDHAVPTDDRADQAARRKPHLAERDP